MDKKAGITFSTLLFSFFRLFILFLVAFSLVLFAHFFVKTKIDISDAESGIFAQSIINSPNGISYKDPVTKRVYPGIVDYTTFSNKAGLEAQLNNALYLEKNSIIAGAIELLTVDMKPYRSLSPIYYNKDYYDVWYTMGKTGYMGLGSAKIREKLYPVLIRDSGELKQGILKITIAIPNS